MLRPFVVNNVDVVVVVVVRDCNLIHARYWTWVMNLLLLLVIAFVHDGYFGLPL